VLRYLPAVTDPNALVGAASADDAAVYQISPDIAIVATVDYITPVVDDPYTWGTIAAANAISDVYAMGARPIFGLNLVNFPRDTLPMEWLERVIEGGGHKASEAGIPILGGHSVDDPEPKFGMVVLGTVHPQHAVCNVGARPGDALLLTKPLGIGMITTALKRGLASHTAIEMAIESMAALNKAAGEAMLDCSGLHAATDVTGFGLLGHASEMLGAGDVGLRIQARSVPVIPAAWEYVREGIVAGGTRRNLAAVAPMVRWQNSGGEDEQLILADAQTSGGLLIAIAPDQADALLTTLHQRGVTWAARIGTFTDDFGMVTVVDS
jgi:selenide, water dikinase